jgi:hypothetical protein
MLAGREARAVEGGVREVLEGGKAKVVVPEAA